MVGHGYHSYVDEDGEGTPGRCHSPSHSSKNSNLPPTVNPEEDAYTQDMVGLMQEVEKTDKVDGLLMGVDRILAELRFEQLEIECDLSKSEDFSSSRASTRSAFIRTQKKKYQQMLSQIGDQEPERPGTAPSELFSRNLKSPVEEARLRGSIPKPSSIRRPYRRTRRTLRDLDL